jgi:phosphatidylglycerol:prolipoprotein diacylglycerol transferase
VSQPLLAGRRWLRWRGLQVSSYKAALYLGTVLGTFVGAAAHEAGGGDPGRFAWVTILLMVPALVGARAWFVLGNRHHFAGGARVLARSEGGAALYGGLVLAIVTSVPVLAITGVGFGAFWDAAALTMLVGLLVTRIGCHMNGCCAGRSTERFIGRVLPDASGRWLRRWPTQLLEMAWGLVVLGAAVACDPLLGVSGSRFVFVVALYCAGRVFLEATRADSWAPRTAVRLVTRLG